MSAIGQVEQTARYERDHKNNDSDYILVPMEERGMVLIHDKDKYREGKKLWEVITLNIDLDEVWSMEMDIEVRLRLVGYDYKDDLIYILFRTSEHDGSDLNLFTIHSKTQEVKRYAIKQELTFKVTHFVVLSRAIVLGGYVNNDPAVLVYDLETENLKIVPGFFIAETELLDLRINANNTFNTLILERKTSEKKKLILKTFDATGAMLFDDIIEIDKKRSILSGITSMLKNDELLITGTWSVGTSKQASGIYSVLADPFREQTINFYDFGSLEHFLDYQSPKHASRIKQRSISAKSSGNIPDFKAYTALVRMEEQPKGFAVLAEVYQPSANFNSTPYYSGFSNPYYYGGGYSPYGYNPFMSRYYNPPYQYNGATSTTGETKILYSSIFVFDLKGELTHDYGISLDNKKVTGVEQTADFIFDKDHVSIAFKDERNIFIKHNTPDGSTLDTLQTTLQRPGEIVRSDSQNGYVRFWYQNFMYAWGYQRIKDQEKQSEVPNRYVFYINKIRID
jgi:hypothetical protein